MPKKHLPSCWSLVPANTPAPEPDLLTDEELAEVHALYQPRIQYSIQTASQRLGGGEEHVAPTSAIPCVAQPHFVGIGYKTTDTLYPIRSPETNELKTLAVDQHRGCGSLTLQLRRVESHRETRKSCTDVREQHHANREFEAATSVSSRALALRWEPTQASLARQNLSPECLHLAGEVQQPLDAILDQHIETSPTYPYDAILEALARLTDYYEGLQAYIDAEIEKAIAAEKADA